MPNPRDVLVAYSNQQATTEQVWRALTEHDAWYVPATFAVRCLHTTTSKAVQVFATEVPTSDSALILFTDPIAAARADGAPIGPFMHEFSGVRIFQALENRYGCVRVNPHSPKTEGWYISQEAFPLAKLWAQVVGLEQAIARIRAAHSLTRNLINAQHLPITLNLGQGSCAVAFKSPDGFQSFVDKQPADLHPNLKSATLDGVTLCRQLGSFEVAGVAVYSGDGSRTVLRKEEFGAVTGAGA